VNKKGKSQKRSLVITDKSIYKQDPNNYKVRKSEIPLSGISAVSMSNNRDTFVVLHANAPYRDLVLDLGINGPERYSEFVTVVVDQVKKLTDANIPVKFATS
jgi:hypothetical protein